MCSCPNPRTAHRTQHALEKAPTFSSVFPQKTEFPTDTNPILLLPVSPCSAPMPTHSKRRAGRSMRVGTDTLPCSWRPAQSPRPSGRPAQSPPPSGRPAQSLPPSGCPATLCLTRKSSTSSVSNIVFQQVRADTRLWDSSSAGPGRAGEPARPLRCDWTPPGSERVQFIRSVSANTRARCQQRRRREGGGGRGKGITVWWRQ